MELDTYGRQILSLHLDPILRLISKSVEQHRQLVSVELPDNEKVLASLKGQAELLEILQNALVDLSQDDLDLVESLVSIMDAISLPLLAILHTVSEDIAKQEEMCLSAPQSRIRKSAEWKSIEIAAQTMATYLKCCVPRALGEKRCFPNETLIRCLVACVAALPSKRGFQRESGLDQGESCVTAVFNAIEHLVLAQDLSDAIAEALDGNLVACVVDACMTVLTPGERKVSSDLLLDALRLLRVLMTAIPRAELWQRILAGSFVGIYLGILDGLRISSARPTRVVKSYLDAMTELLRITLTSPVVTEEPSAALACLQALANRQTKSPSVTTIAEPSAESNDFWLQVNTKLPAPLTILLNHFLGSQQPKLREGTVWLCRVLLIDAGRCWKEQSALDLKRSALECVLGLANDVNDEVETSANCVLRDYRESLGSRFSSDLLSLIVPRVPELLEGLSPVAQSRREVELRMRLKLITGYLSLFSTLSNRHRDSLGSWLMSEDLSGRIREVLTDLLDIDFSHIQRETIVSLLVLENPRLLSSGTKRRFRYMTDETSDYALKMIHQLGRAIGMKQAVLFIDKCVADMFKSCVDNVEKGVAFTGKLHLAWLHEWVGSTVLIREVLVGAFSTVTETVPDSFSGRRNKRRVRYLNSLARCVFPVATSAPLWNLPTRVEDPSDLEQSVEANTTSHSLRYHLGSSKMPHLGQRSVDALNGNARLQCELLEFIGYMFQSLLSDGTQYLPNLLFSLFEKACPGNLREIQQAAASVLHQVAVSAGFEDMADMVHQNFGLLMGAIMGRLRINGNIVLAASQLEESDAVSSANMAYLLLKTAAGQNLKFPDHGNLAAAASSMLQMVTSLTERFDIALEPASRDSLSLPLLRVYEAAFYYLLSCYSCSVKIDPSFVPSKVAPKKERWTMLLYPFQIQDEPEEPLSSTQGVGALSAETTQDKTTEDKAPKLYISVHEIDRVSLFMTRSSYLLSSSTLKMQVASCESLIAGFSFLGAVSLNQQPSEESANGPGTAILRQASASWPAIIARIRAISAGLMSARTSCRVVVLRVDSRPQNAAPSGSSGHLFFLSKLFDLVAVMCVNCGHFMSRFFREDVWPILADLLGDFATEKKRQYPFTGNGPGSRKEQCLENSGLRAQDRTSGLSLLITTCNCLEKIFSHRECGMALVSLIPTAGTLLVPLLQYNGDVANAAMGALKKMLAIECDSLWRPLLYLSGRPIPRRPLRPRPVARAEGAKTQSHILGLRANELIEYIDALPEPPLT